MSQRVHRTFAGAATFTLFLAAAQAAQAQETALPAGAELEEVVVTGYRASLNEALDIKRSAAGSVDAIVGEDIGKFPDLNLAEAIQRIPGVTIARDAGEGRQISVRGLSPEFTRVRVNGIEAMSANGGTDAAGGTNRTRGFDFNTFASELFNSIKVRKSASADIDEGSLGATVDLQTGRPFDFDGMQFVVTGQAMYNDLSEDFDPRGALLVSNTWGDGTFGALFSAAYTKRNLVDEGSSSVRWGTPSGGFAGLAPGYTGTATLAQLNAAFAPRIPRYDYYEHEQERIGLTGSLQWAPNDRVQVNLDALYAQFDATRKEIFLEIPNFSAAANGISVQDAVIAADNSIVYGVFNNVDIRSENRYDELSTDFTQVTLDGTFEFTDRLRATAIAGFSEANHENPKQTTLLFDWLGTNQLTYDYRDSSRLPLISYGTTDLTSNVQGLAPPPMSPTTYQSNGWYLSQVRLRPQSSINSFSTVGADLEFDMNESWKIKGGLNYKDFEFKTTEARRSNGTNANLEANIPAGVAGVPISTYSEIIKIARGLSVPAGTNTEFLIPNMSEANELFDLYNTNVWALGPEPALGNNRTVREKDSGVFLMVSWDTEIAGHGLRGNAGVRYVETDQTSTGYSYFSGSPQYIVAQRTYENTLPSLNLVFDATDDFLIRFSAAQVMSRPGLNGINPGGTVTVSGSARTAALGNPTLDPTEGTAYDLGFEWYFAPESLLSLALFYKDIESRPTGTTYSGPFTGNPFGIPDSVAIAACGATPGCSPSAEWVFNTTVNGDGGWLRGAELTYQQPFSFLPGIFANFGTSLNYTYIDSEFKYPNGSDVIIEQLDGLSKYSWNATLYYETPRFGARVSAGYRDDFLTRIPGQNNNSVEGTIGTLGVDASVRYSLNDNLDFTLEATNLTDEFQDQYVNWSNRPSFYHHTGRNFILGVRVSF